MFDVVQHEQQIYREMSNIALKKSIYDTITFSLIVFKMLITKFPRNDF